MDVEKIFILYSERSGSNLLRVLLDNHPELSAPVPPQFFDSFMPYANRFGNLKKKENTLRLISVMKKYANHPFSDWKLNISANKIYSDFTPENFVEVVDSLYSSKAMQENKTGYVCKENHLFDYCGFITTTLSETNTNWIYLHRDPRDVVSSWLKNKILFFTAYEAAHSWKKEQKKCISLKLSHDLSYHQLSYENLISDTKEVITDLLHFLELNIHERCFRNQQERKEAKRNVLWKNLNKPIDSSNTKNYLDVLSEKQTRKVESVCKRQMNRLGYQLETNGQWNPPIGEEKYRYYSKLKEVVKKAISKNDTTSELIQDRNKLKIELVNNL